MHLIPVVREGVRIFRRSSGFTNAAAISFYAFFSLIPVMFLVTAGVGFVLGANPDLQARTIGMVRKSLPYISQRIIEDFIELSGNWKTFGWIGLLSLISGAELVTNAAVSALTSIFGTRHRFGFLRTRAVGLLVILLAIIASLASIAVTALSFMLERHEINFFGLGYVYELFVIAVFRFIVPFLMVSSVIAVVYRVLAVANLDFRNAFFGSILFTVLWEAAKQLFALYVSNFQSYNRFYGSLGTLMILLMWIFYSVSIFLFSASVARAAYQGSRGGSAQGSAAGLQ
ncbi:MAG: hypothetical protein A2054_02800 [Deltaproteobacteria bacterium GWA2_55_10]|nr:MAG: hypothetical protein A2054_02800 [Deltaproteobacteria bacterium GWA2_55_10]